MGNVSPAVRKAYRRASWLYASPRLALLLPHHDISTGTMKGTEAATAALDSGGRPRKRNSNSVVARECGVTHLPGTRTHAPARARFVTRPWPPAAPPELPPGRLRSARLHTHTTKCKTHFIKCVHMLLVHM